PAAICIWWWFYLPTYHRNQQIALAHRLLEEGETARAEEALRLSLKEQPDDTEALLLHANLLRKLGRKIEASRDLQHASEIGLPPNQSRREQALLDSSDEFAKAEGPLQRVLKSDPSDAEVGLALAGGYLQLRRFADAENTYTSLIEVHPERTDFLLERGKVRLEAGH